jgi:formyl-CoA transferase
VFARLAVAMERPDLGERYATHSARAGQQSELDGEIAAWSGALDADVLLAVLEEHSIPAGRIHTAPDLAADPQFAAREMILRLAAGYSRDVPMAGVVPKLSRTPGAVRTVGPALGAHTEEVLRELTDLSEPEIDALRANGVVE